MSVGAFGVELTNTFYYVCTSKQKLFYNASPSISTQKQEKYYISSALADYCSKIIRFHPFRSRNNLINARTGKFLGASAAITYNGNQ